MDEDGLPGSHANGTPERALFRVEIGRQSVQSRQDWLGALEECDPFRR